MAKIYLPEEYVNMPCKQVNNGYIRVYRTTNTNYSNVVYDIFVDQDYQVRQTTASYNTNTYCDTVNSYTSDYFYRVDFVDYLKGYLILLFLFVYVPWKFFICRFFRRFN